jgi:hypothetical protein
VALDLMIRRIINWIGSLLAVLMLGAMSIGFFSMRGMATVAGVTFLFWNVAAGLALFGRLLDRPWHKLAWPYFVLGFAPPFAYLAYDPSTAIARLRPEAENARDWLGPLALWLNSEFGPTAVRILFALAGGLFFGLAVLELMHQARAASVPDRRKAHEV